ncbi:hypothetical protein TNCV_3662671 [Trichonephila clavipes]|nr:hypothetical protein TNCV_3662671 [Trichonephila clavipes]
MARKKKSNGVKSGDRDGHRTRPICPIQGLGSLVFSMFSSKKGGNRTKRKIADKHDNFQGKWRTGDWIGTATAGSDVVQSGHPIFDDFFQHLWPYIGNNTANVVFQMVKRLWLIRIDQ